VWSAVESCECDIIGGVWVGEITKDSVLLACYNKDRSSVVWGYGWAEAGAGNFSSCNGAPQVVIHCGKCWIKTARVVEELSESRLVAHCDVPWIEVAKLLRVDLGCGGKFCAERCGKEWHVTRMCEAGKDGCIDIQGILCVQAIPNRRAEAVTSINDLVESPRF
jgi:hypothetical protein